MYEPGNVIDGKFEVVRLLGKGGMGEVLLVRHLHLEELRVVKILRKDLAGEANAQKRFLREARLATQIKHPNVAILYDFAQLPDGEFYMVWEHIEGRHVGQWLSDQGAFPVLGTLQLGIQTLRGLEAIHASGVIHRDLSPDNLMITEDRRGRQLVKIIDLGLAKNLVADDPTYEVTQVGMFMGKLRYCSPEQADPEKGDGLDRRSDLYSFALVLYEMFCGLPPFEADSPHGAVMKRLLEEPVPLSQRNPDLQLPLELDRVVGRALAKNREDRYDDAVQFIEELERVAFALRGAETQKVEMPRKAVRRSPRRKNDETLTKAERVELLSQIQEAARRKKRREEREASKQIPTQKMLSPQPAEAGSKTEETSAVRAQKEIAGRLGEAESLLRAHQLDEAKEVLGELKDRGHAPEEVAQLESRVDTVEQQSRPEADPAQRRKELEAMLSSYMKNQQLPLAELTLETLVDLFPEHPKREEYESWVSILRDEVEQDRRAEETLAKARQALERGDSRGVRKRLAELKKHDRRGDLVAAFEREMASTERTERQEADVEEHKERFEELLGKGDLQGAERELDQMTRAGAARLTVDMYRARLADETEKYEQTIRAEEFEDQFRKKLEAQDFHGARDIALELERTLPMSSRPAQMFAEISRVEEQRNKRQAVEQGAAQVRELIAQGEADQAEMALSILLRMEPDYTGRTKLKKDIEALRG